MMQVRSLFSIGVLDRVAFKEPSWRRILGSLARITSVHVQSSVDLGRAADMEELRIIRPPAVTWSDAVDGARGRMIGFRFAETFAAADHLAFHSGSNRGPEP